MISPRATNSSTPKVSVSPSSSTQVLSRSATPSSLPDDSNKTKSLQPFSSKDRQDQVKALGGLRSIQVGAEKEKEGANESRNRLPYHQNID